MKKLARERYWSRNRRKCPWRSFRMYTRGCFNGCTYVITQTWAENCKNVTTYYSHHRAIVCDILVRRSKVNLVNIQVNTFLKIEFKNLNFKEEIYYNNN